MADNFFDPNSDDGDEAPSVDTTVDAAPVNPEPSLPVTGDDGNFHRLEKTFEDADVLKELGAVSEEKPRPIAEEAVSAVNELLLEPLLGNNDAALALSQATTTEAPAEAPLDLLSDSNTVFDTQTTTADAATTSESIVESVVEPVVTHEETTPTTLLASDQVHSDMMAAKLRLLEDMFVLVLSEHPFEILVERCLQILMRSVDAQAGSVLELDHNTDEYFFRASRGGASDKVKAFRVPAKQGIVGYVGESHQVLLLNDLADDKLQLKAISVAVGFEARSCMAAPVLIGNKLYGVVEVFNKMGTLYFTDRERAVIEHGAAIMAKVLEVRFFVAELFRRTQGK